MEDLYKRNSLFCTGSDLRFGGLHTGPGALVLSVQAPSDEHTGGENK